MALGAIDARLLSLGGSTADCSSHVGADFLRLDSPFARRFELRFEHRRPLCRCGSSLAFSFQFIRALAPSSRWRIVSCLAWASSPLRLRDSALQGRQFGAQRHFRVAPVFERSAASFSIARSVISSRCSASEDSSCALAVAFSPPERVDHAFGVAADGAGVEPLLLGPVGVAVDRRRLVDEGELVDALGAVQVDIAPQHGRTHRLADVVRCLLRKCMTLMYCAPLAARLRGAAGSAVREPIEDQAP